MTQILRSNGQMIGALALRQLEGKRDALRSRVESDPRQRFASDLRDAEQALFLRNYVRAADVLEALRDKLDLRDEDAAAEAANDAQVRLLAERGVETAREGKGPLARDGWTWLVKKGRVTPERRATGDRWSLDYALVRSDGLRSCLNDRVGGGEDTAAEARQRAAERLTGGRARIVAATGKVELAGLLDAVCGRGETVRELAGGEDRRAIGVEAQLMVALDIAGHRLSIPQPLRYATANEIKVLLDGDISHQGTYPIRTCS